MFPYSGRPTEEFLREYRNKLNELQELMESQGLKLEIKSGGRCKVAPEVRAGIGKVSGEGVHFHSCGNVRKAMKLIRSVEEIGRYKNLEVVSQADLDD